jgi:hypothetical protein
MTVYWELMMMEMMATVGVVAANLVLMNEGVDGSTDGS